MSKYGNGVCPHCGKEFERKGGGHIYCSKECRSGAGRLIRDNVDAKIHEGGEWAECQWCGKWFKRPYKSRKLYCSTECKYQGMTATEKEKREKRKRRLGIKKAKPKDGFTWDDIRKVFAEYGISSYHKAIEILQERQKEKEQQALRESD